MRFQDYVGSTAQMFVPYVLSENSLFEINGRDRVVNVTAEKVNKGLVDRAVTLYRISHDREDICKNKSRM